MPTFIRVICSRRTDGVTQRSAGFTPARRSAEHSFESSWRSAEHGFTLVELMVVVVILAIASAAVVMSIPDPAGRVTDDADRFAARATAARDAAIIQATPMSIWVSPSGYGFARRVAGRWLPVEDKPFVTTEWRGGAAADVTSVGPSRVIFDTTGAAVSPLAVVLRRGSKQARVTIGADGRVTVGG